MNNTTQVTGKYAAFWSKVQMTEEKRQATRALTLFEWDIVNPDFLIKNIKERLAAGQLRPEVEPMIREYLAELQQAKKEWSKLRRMTDARKDLDMPTIIARIVTECRSSAFGMTEKGGNGEISGHYFNASAGELVYEESFWHSPCRNSAAAYLNDWGPNGFFAKYFGKKYGIRFECSEHEDDVYVNWDAHKVQVFVKVYFK